jgi:hypothetical protein
MSVIESNINKLPPKVYIAGKITGLPIPIYSSRFNCAEDALRAHGYRTLNPIRIVPQDLDYEDQMEICLKLVQVADIIYMLENWEQSNGAKREHAYAATLGKRVVYQGGKNEVLQSLYETHT